MVDDFAEFLERAGAIVGGGAALGGAVGFLLGSIGRDMGISQRDPLDLAETGAQVGGILGLVAFWLGGRDVQ